MTKILASHILLDTEQECNEVKEKITDAESFADFAKNFSRCPSGKNGGDLGEFDPDSMVAPFKEAAIAAPLNEVYGPVETQFGYHILLVKSRV